MRSHAVLWFETPIYRQQKKQLVAALITSKTTNGQACMSRDAALGPLKGRMTITPVCEARRFLARHRQRGAQKITHEF
jgi:hypothetical protein